MSALNRSYRKVGTKCLMDRVLSASALLVLHTFLRMSKRRSCTSSSLSKSWPMSGSSTFRPSISCKDAALASVSRLSHRYSSLLRSLSSSSSTTCFTVRSWSMSGSAAGPESVRLEAALLHDWGPLDVQNLRVSAKSFRKTPNFVMARSKEEADTWLIPVGSPQWKTKEQKREVHVFLLCKIWLSYTSP